MADREAPPSADVWSLLGFMPAEEGMVNDKTRRKGRGHHRGQQRHRAGHGPAVCPKKGRIDVLFANAGLAGESTPLGKISEELFDTLFDVNVRGLLFTV